MTYMHVRTFLESVIFFGMKTCKHLLAGVPNIMTVKLSWRLNSLISQKSVLCWRHDLVRLGLCPTIFLLGALSFNENAHKSRVNGWKPMAVLERNSQKPMGFAFSVEMDDDGCHRLAASFDTHEALRPHMKFSTPRFSIGPLGHWVRAAQALGVCPAGLNCRFSAGHSTEGKNVDKDGVPLSKNCSWHEKIPHIGVIPGEKNIFGEVGSESGWKSLAGYMLPGTVFMFEGWPWLASFPLLMTGISELVLVLWPIFVACLTHFLSVVACWLQTFWNKTTTF